MSLLYTSRVEIPTLGIDRGYVITIEPEHPTYPIIVSFELGRGALAHLAENAGDLTPHGPARRLTPLDLQIALLAGLDVLPLRAFRDLKAI